MDLENHYEFRRDGDLSITQYYLILSEPQRRAVRYVELFKQIILFICTQNKIDLKFKSNQLEKCFVQFAEGFGLVGPLFELNKEGYCPAFAMAHDYRSIGAGGSADVRFRADRKAQFTFLKRFPKKDIAISVVSSILGPRVTASTP